MLNGGKTMKAVFKISNREEERTMIVEVRNEQEAEQAWERLRGMYRRVDLVSYGEIPTYRFAEVMTEPRLVYVA
jgi:hypothetical protein